MTATPEQVLELHHETHGTDRPGSTPLLLVHGGAGTTQAHFGALIPALAEDRLVVGVELQGHGRTRHADRAYTPAHNAADVVAVLDRLELARVDLLAFSNGCLTALRLAVHHRPRLQRMVLASGFATRDGMVAGFWDQFETADVTTLPPDLARAYAAIDPDPASLQRMFELDLALMRGAVDHSPAELAAIEVPTLVLSGDADIVRPEHTVELARQLGDGRACVLPAGHGDYLGSVESGARDDHLLPATLSLLRRFLSGAGTTGRSVG